MSRSVGDTVAKSVGVISEPECFQTTLVGSGTLIISSDGLTEFMSDTEIYGIVRACRGDLKSSIRRLQDTSKTKWLQNDSVTDDTTIIIAHYRA